MKRFCPILSAVVVSFGLFQLSVRANDDRSSDHPHFELRDDDRVVFLGNTFVERMQAYGYLETLLTAWHPDRRITFRNLGWSGDDVWGTARALFGSRADGFKRLIKDVTEAKPTVIVVGYGANEAYAGLSGLEDFRAGLTRLLNSLDKATGARLVLLSPLPRKRVASSMPDPSRYNRSAEEYAEAIRKAASQHSARFVDLSNFFERQPHLAPLTTNGLHLTEFGYWLLANTLVRDFAAPRGAWFVGIDMAKRQTRVHGTKVSKVNFTDGQLRFQINDQVLPPPLPPIGSPQHLQAVAAARLLRVVGLPVGRYRLMIDQKPVAEANADGWAKGMDVRSGPQFADAEELCDLIQKKNELYFHRYRPQNETYLFLFRKHEQGNNAVEIPQFDPLIAEKEKQIAALKKPKTKIFQLVRVKAQESGNK